jgi:hypothetical protein
VKFSAKIDSKASAITPTCSKIPTSPSIRGAIKRLAGIEFFNGIGQELPPVGRGGTTGA